MILTVNPTGPDPIAHAAGHASSALSMIIP
jgi:hypothetical protein